MPEVLYLLGLALVLLVYGRFHKVRWCRYGLYAAATLLMIVAVALFIAEFLALLAIVAAAILFCLMLILPRPKTGYSNDTARIKTHGSGSLTIYDRPSDE